MIVTSRESKKTTTTKKGRQRCFSVQATLTQVLINQPLWGQGPTICILKIYPGDSYVIRLETPRERSVAPSRCCQVLDFSFQPEICLLSSRMEGRPPARPARGSAAPAPRCSSGAVPFSTLSPVLLWGLWALPVLVFPGWGSLDGWSEEVGDSQLLNPRP